MLGYISKIVACNISGPTPLFSTSVATHNCVQFGKSQGKNSVTYWNESSGEASKTVKRLRQVIEQVKRRGWEHWVCSEKSKEDLIAVFRYLMERYRKSEARHFSDMHSDSAKDIKHRLEHRKLSLFDHL